MFKEDIKQNEKEIREDDIMDEAYEELERLSSDLGIIGLYDKEKVEQKIINTRLLDAERRGKKEGINERNIEIAKNMLNENIDILTIQRVTGLPKEQIEELKQISVQQDKEDIEKYGVYTYEEFSSYTTEYVFNAINMKYYKISVGKGIMTYEDVLGVLETYNALLENGELEQG